jgi:hypothetical protein
MKVYPQIKIEMIDKDKPPTSRNVRVYMDGEDITHVVNAVTVEMSAGDMTYVTLRLFAHVETDYLTMTGGEL